MSALPSHFKAHLAKHVRACRVDDQIIFLDLLRNKYIGVRAPEMAGFWDTILGPCSGEAVSSAPSSAGIVMDWLRRLRDQNLLSEETIEPLHPAEPVLPEPTTSYLADAEDVEPVADWRQLARLWRSVIVSSGWVRGHTLAHIAAEVAALRPRHKRHAEEAQTNAMRFAVAAYVYWRPFALTTHDRCLNDSLALIHFMAAQGLYPRWVIGVQVHPFGAHSWVQSGSAVLNDLPERVRRYRPILVV